MDLQDVWKELQRRRSVCLLHQSHILIRMSVVEKTNVVGVRGAKSILKMKWYRKTLLDKLCKVEYAEKVNNKRRIIKALIRKST